MNKIVFDRVKVLCQKNNISINKLEKELGFGVSTVSKWKTQNPQSDKLLLVANYFNVTSDYLIGLVDTPNRPSTINNDIDLIRIQRARQYLNNEDKNKMMKILKITFEKAFAEENNDENKI